MRLVDWMKKEIARILEKDVTACDFKEVNEMCDYVLELHNNIVTVKLIQEYTPKEKPSTVKYTGMTCMLCGSTERTKLGACANDDCPLNKRRA